MDALHVEFLIRDTIVKLQTTICNSLSLGNFEIASALFHIHYDLTPNACLQLLEEIIKKGPSDVW